MQSIFLALSVLGYACAYPTAYYHPNYYGNYIQPAQMARYARPASVMQGAYYQGAQRGAADAAMAFVYGDRIASGGYVEQPVDVETNQYYPAQRDEERREKVTDRTPLSETFENDATSIAQAHAEPEKKIPVRDELPEEPASDAAESIDDGTKLTIEKPSRPIAEQPQRKPAHAQPEAPPRPAKRRPSYDEEDEVENRFDSRVPMAFFPMYFGSNPGSRASSGQSGAPGATAIANSYSTGRGGVATSHATAYGSGKPSRS